jgi:hypothetical protein
MDANGLVRSYRFHSHQDHKGTVHRRRRQRQFVGVLESALSIIFIHRGATNQGR